jgi:hypothetical protein
MNGDTTPVHLFVDAITGAPTFLTDQDLSDLADQSVGTYHGDRGYDVYKTTLPNV